LLVCLIAAGCAAHHPPPVAREFRAAWVATVANIDWPSKPGLSSEQQQWEMRQILDKARAIGLNAIIFQVRTSCDAMYPSPYEPWSYYLTGQQGKAADYDPLEMWVREAHRRGLELHAWFNPYRAKPPNATYTLDASHVANRQPDLAKHYGSVLWLDPGEPAAQDYTLAVMMDVVRRYDVDGIHIDDYFYPYPVNDPATGKPIDFPDDSSWKRYQMTGRQASAPQTREDWRRENINRLVRRMYAETKSLKPWVKVGISPFGIWKPGYPSVVKGFNQYESIYADAKLWLNEGWCDYFTPQLYWKTTAANQPFEALLRWWAGENRLSRHLWPGLFTSRIEAAKAPTTGPGTRAAATTAASDRIWTPHEILDQIAVTRRTPGVTGHVHFSMITLAQDRRDVDERLAQLYAEPALVPASPWLDGRKPLAAATVTARFVGGNLNVSWTPGDARETWLWVVRVAFGSRWKTTIVPGAMREIEILNDQELAPIRVVVTAVSRVGIEGEPATAKVATGKR
jgi:uncharacterized lipoprotein YddW (UPF0748 family)